MELARDRVAALLPPGGKVIFTSGATEAINTVLRGSKGDVLTFAAEHAAVLDCKPAVEAQGRKFEILPVKSGGRADLVELRKAAAKKTALRRLRLYSFCAGPMRRRLFSLPNEAKRRVEGFITLRQQPTSKWRGCQILK